MWIVFRNGKETGIIVSNYAYEVKYWAKRSLITGDKFTLRLWEPC